MYCFYKIVIIVIIIICILLSRLILYCAYCYINGNFYIHCGASLEYWISEYECEYEYEQLKQLRVTRFVGFVHVIFYVEWMWWKKSINLVFLSVIHHCQSPVLLTHLTGKYASCIPLLQETWRVRKV
jgi:hypothetical protein